MQRSIKYQGVKIWNFLPQSIQKLPKTSFKIKLKWFLFSLIIRLIPKIIGLIRLILILL